MQYRDQNIAISANQYFPAPLKYIYVKSYIHIYSYIYIYIEILTPDKIHIFPLLKLLL